jgi:hypothetical protein
MTKLEKLLEIMNERTRKSDIAWERALYHLLCCYKDKLPPLNYYFHKAFRQTDVTADIVGNGHLDMVFYNLLYDSVIFWEIFDELDEEKELEK